jgi:DNA-binding beta-propeller fold protein YncE
MFFAWEFKIKNLVYFALFASMVICPVGVFAKHKPQGQLVSHQFNIYGAPAAKAVAISPDGSEIWAALLMNKTQGLSVFSAIDGKKITDIDLNGGGGVEIVFSKDGTKAYVSQMETARVFEIDTNEKKILRTFNTKSNWTKVIEISPDGKKLYASNWLGNNVSEFDLESGKRATVCICMLLDSTVEKFKR